MDNKNSSEQLVDIIKILGTPFYKRVEMDEKPYIVMGDYLVRSKEEYKRGDEARLENTDWEMVATIVAIIVENINKTK